MAAHQPRRRFLKILSGLALATALLLPACGGGGKEIQNLGSDTLLEVAGALAETYVKEHPTTLISVSGGGSAVGIKNLIDGDVDIANSSRPMTEKEIESAKAKGQNPVEHKIGYDGIAIFVHKENPIASITMEQLKQVFADGGTINSWKDLGVDFGSDDANKVKLGSRQNNSGTYECFRDYVLGGSKARFRPECNLLNSSTDVVAFCADTKSAIGYSGIAAASNTVKIVPVVKAAGGAPVLPTVDTILDGTYAIARPLFMYTNGEPEGEIKSYLDWIKSPVGQRVLLDKGYVSLKKL
jgi:phosphate transport system substrate-binding protein